VVNVVPISGPWITDPYKLYLTKDLKNSQKSIFSTFFENFESDLGCNSFKLFYIVIDSLFEKAIVLNVVGFWALEIVKTIYFGDHLSKI
jgi:hypothetical protein